MDTNTYYTNVKHRKHGSSKVVETQFMTPEAAQEFVDKHRQVADKTGRITHMGDWDYFSVSHDIVPGK